MSSILMSSRHTNIRFLQQLMRNCLDLKILNLFDQHQVFFKIKKKKSSFFPDVKFDRTQMSFTNIQLPLPLTPCMMAVSAIVSVLFLLAILVLAPLSLRKVHCNYFVSESHYEVHPSVHLVIVFTFSFHRSPNGTSPTPQRNCTYVAQWNRTACGTKKCHGFEQW